MDKVLHHQLHDKQGTSENSSTLVGPAASEAVIVVRSEESASVSAQGDSKAEVNELETRKVSAEDWKVGVPKPEGHTCVIDVKCSGGTLSSENRDGERTCRICLLSSDQSTDVSDTIQLGCVCTGELGFAHLHCAETWFRIKGNRCCEICGETAKNITGVGDNRFMEEWNESGFATSSTDSSGRCGACWQGQPFCNFLMACIVIAFVLPWFLRINMF